VFLLLLAVSRDACAIPDEASFAVANAPWAWSFPRDHGSHIQFQTEWWYFTGTLYDEGAQPFRDAPRYGVQLVFFRRAAAPGAAQFYLAHSAVTDLRTKNFVFESRVADGATRIAGADERLLSLWNGVWGADQLGEQIALKFKVRNQYEVRLAFDPDGPPLFHGVNGLSAKGVCIGGCNSFYYSFPRARLSGSVIDGGRVVPVRGLGWFDHEFMTNALGEGQVGWDWLSLARGNGDSLMLFQVRHTDPSKDFRSGTLRRGGVDLYLEQDEIQMEPRRRWKSPTSGGEYPVEWNLRVPKYGIDTQVVARLDGCELDWQADSGLPTYWEGPVRGRGEDEVGYLEMTGYSRPLDKPL
jgi:predicted secreted hydrolase